MAAKKNPPKGETIYIGINLADSETCIYSRLEDVDPDYYPLCIKVNVPARMEQKRKQADAEVTLK